MTRLQYLDFFTYLPDDILTKVDRVSMSVALEVRVPLLSRELVEFAFALPESVRYHDRRLKGLLKQTYRDVLPHSIIARGKRGFGIPRGYLATGSTAFPGYLLKRSFDTPIPAPSFV